MVFHASGPPRSPVLHLKAMLETELEIERSALRVRVAGLGFRGLGFRIQGSVNLRRKPLP